jgi:hypothetical protein
MGNGAVRRVLLAAAASVVAVSLTACGGGEDKAKVPSAGGAGNGAPAAAGNDVAAYVNAQREWVKCLREQGLDVPDPNAMGVVEFGDNRAVKQNPVFLRATEKCASLQVAVPESVEEAQRPKLSAEQIETRERYAECMQGNGAPDFPDPGPDGYAPQDAEWDQQSAGARRATRTCAPIIGAPMDPPTDVRG